MDINITFKSSLLVVHSCMIPDYVVISPHFVPEAHIGEVEADTEIAVSLHEATQSMPDDIAHEENDTELRRENFPNAVILTDELGNGFKNSFSIDSAHIPLLNLGQIEIPSQFSLKRTDDLVKFKGLTNEYEKVSTESEPSCIQDVFERLPTSTFQLFEDRNLFADVPPVPAREISASMVLCDIPPLPFTDVCAMNMSKKLLKLRLHHDKMKSNLDREIAVYDTLVSQEEMIDSKILHRTEIVRSLTEKADKMALECKESDAVYKIQQHSLRVIQGYISETSDALERESARFNEYSAKLARIRLQYPRVEEEYENIAAQCAILNEKCDQATKERNKLEGLLTHIIKSNTDGAEGVHIVSKGTQTICDFAVLEEIEGMRLELRAQLANMKKVQNAIQLVRRCT